MSECVHEFGLQMRSLESLKDRLGDVSIVLVDATGQTGLGTLIMNGAGRLLLSANNTCHTVNGTAVAGFTGGVTLNSGTLELRTGASAGSGGVTFRTDGAATLVIDVADAAAIAGCGNEKARRRSLDPTLDPNSR